MKNALVAGLVTTLIWTCLQFGLSEVLYQLSRSSYDWGLPSEAEQFFGQASDVVAFPAGWIYEVEEKRLIPVRLGTIGSDEQFSPEVREKARELRSQMREPPPDSEEAIYTQSVDFIYENTTDPILPLFREYFIYVGVCLAWGSLIGFLVFLFILLELRNQKPA